jgi:hypothetical protein
VEYYRTPEGKCKKSLQNGKRSKGESKPDSGSKQGGNGGSLDGNGHRFNAGMVCYLSMVTSLIEERRVSRSEILEMLARVMRQHTMVPRKRIDYVLWYLGKNAP